MSVPCVIAVTISDTDSISNADVESPLNAYVGHHHGPGDRLIIFFMLPGHDKKKEDFKMLRS